MHLRLHSERDPSVDRTFPQGYEVHACDIEAGTGLQALQCRLHILDVRSPESIKALATQLANKPVDVLLNVAGVMSPPGRDTLETVDAGVLARTFETNTYGPLLLTQALLPNLQLSTSPRVGIVSSRVGSIGDNSSGGSYAYRASKAAVNSIGKNLAVDLHKLNVVVSLLHPGFVRSNLLPNEPPHPESVEPQEAAGKLWSVMQTKGLEESGKFWHREGHELPW